MIGVIADSEDHGVVREFFELFKTPWEFFRVDQRYDVLLCAGDYPYDGVDAKLVIVYAGKKIGVDDEQRVRTYRKSEKRSFLSDNTNRIPIYGETVAFADKAACLLRDENSQECMAYLDEVGGISRARIGYDLFGEIRTLLTIGQPQVNASIPALELHIAFLRDLITGCGVSLVEVPPVPAGFQFTACLTHDVDHPSIRQHNLDHTVVGFLLRATLGSLVDACLGRMSIGDALKCWLAAFRLPFVYAGLAKDFWRDFDDRYLALEADLPSTFFLIPRKNYAGKRGNGFAPSLRAVRYEAKELADTISRLKANGREVGLHGIDAWFNSSLAQEELAEIRLLTGVAKVGVRMHWLYFDEDSPQKLDRAGAAYDSTIGYNVTVGYRAGTTQAYRPLETQQLLELPLHAMDTALFYLSYLALSSTKANARLRQLVDNVVRYGGCLTVNWHDRSLAPERFWGGCYRKMVQDMKSRGAWFATATQATDWFRKRRSVVFEADSAEPSAVRARLAGGHRENLPALRLRVHKPAIPAGLGTRPSNAFVDTPLNESGAVLSEAR